MNQDSLIRVRLWDENETVRALAAEDAGYDNLRNLVAPLYERLTREPSRSVRQTIIAALHRMTHTAVISQALALLSTEDVFIRNSMVSLLKAKGMAALSGLDRCFDDSDPDVRKLVLDTLSEIGGDEAERLLTRGLKDPELNVQIAAIEYLGERGSIKQAPAIAAIFESGQDPMLLTAAATALALLGGKSSWVSVVRRFPTFKQVPAYLLGPWLSLLACWGDRSLEDLVDIALQLSPAFGPDCVDALAALQERLGTDTLENSAFERLRDLIARTTDLPTQFRLLKWTGKLQRHPAVVELLSPYLVANDALSRHGAVLGLLRTGRCEVPTLLRAQWARETDLDVLDSIESGIESYERQP